MVGRSSRVLAPSLLAIAVVTVALTLLARAEGAFSDVERATIDTRFAIRGDHVEPDVAVVALDTKSYSMLPRPPLPRTMDAQVIERLHAAGARVVAVDLSLERPSSDRTADLDLVGALERARPAVVSVTAVRAGGGTDPLVGRIPFDRVRGVTPGTTFLYPDSDGTIRRFPSGFHGVGALALVAAERYLGRRVSVPSGALIDYGGPAGTATTISLVNVLRGHFAARKLHGRVVIVGDSALVLGDVHETPADGGGVMPGPEILADAIQTAVDGFPLRIASPMVATILLILLGLAFPLGSLGIGLKRLTGTRIAIAGVVVAVGWSLAAQLSFDVGRVVPYTYGLLAILLGTLLTSSAVAINERRDLRELRARFARHDPELVQAVLDPDREAALSAERIIDGFRLEEQIGLGGMGVVYRARDLALDRDVALKLILDEHAADPGYRAAFITESLNAAAISHQNIVPVFGAGEDNGLLFIVMQFVDDPNLKGWIDMSGPLTPQHAARMALQLGAALDAANSGPRRLVHRDVKPANALMLTDGSHHVYLTDFGLAIDAASDPGPGMKGVGTPDYMAPEQIRGDTVTNRTDIYALAAVVFHSLTGRVPFPRDSVEAVFSAHSNAERPLATELRPDLPSEVDAVIARGMATEPGDRYATASEFAQALATALGGSALRPERVDR